MLVHVQSKIHHLSALIHIATVHAALFLQATINIFGMLFLPTSLPL